MNPCIIIFNRANERYEAYNEDGRLILWSRLNILQEAGKWNSGDYEIVPLNSRIGRTIFDHLPLNVQMQQTTKT